MYLTEPQSFPARKIKPNRDNCAHFCTVSLLEASELLHEVPTGSPEAVPLFWGCRCDSATATGDHVGTRDEEAMAGVLLCTTTAVPGVLCEFS